MIKVLHVMDYNGVFGGLHLFLKSMSNLLKTKGFDFFYLARMRQPYVNNEKLNEFEIPSADEIDIYDYISKIDPDVIHFHDYLEYEQMKWCIEHYPTIRTFHDNYTFCPFGFYRNNKLCDNCVIDDCVKCGCLSKKQGDNVNKYLELQKDIDLITCFSNSILEKCLIYGFDKNNVVKIPTLLREEKEVDVVEEMPEENIIIYSGRIVETKGVECIIRSLIKIKDESWKFILAGTGEKEYVKKLLTLCKKEKILNRVCFLGFLEHDKYIKMLSKSKLFVFSSLAPEGYGYTGAEAMLYAIPIVAFQVDGAEEWLKDGDNGYDVPSGDIDAMAEAILRLINDEEEWKRIKNNAISRRMNLKPIEEQTEILNDMYLKVVQKKGDKK